MRGERLVMVNVSVIEGLLTMKWPSLSIFSPSSLRLGPLAGDN